MSFILGVKKQRVGRQGNVDAEGGFKIFLGYKNK